MSDGHLSTADIKVCMFVLALSLKKNHKVLMSLMQQLVAFDRSQMTHNVICTCDCKNNATHGLYDCNCIPAQW